MSTDARILPLAPLDEGSTSEFLIGPPKRWISIAPRELWRHRELLFFLVWRDIKVRYKQTVLGIAWTIVQPLATMLIFNLFFGRLAEMTSDGLPYAIFALAGLVPWMLFVNGLTYSANSLVGNSNLVTKVYFPRLLMPIAAVMSGVVDLALALVVMLGMMAWYGVGPSPLALLLPLPVTLAVMSSVGAGLWMSALNVQYRDVRHTVPFLCQLWMFATPVLYPASLLSPRWQAVYAFNPMVGAVEGFRWCLLGKPAASMDVLVVSTIVAAVMLVTGAWYFKSMERNFADLV